MRKRKTFEHNDITLKKELILKNCGKLIVNTILFGDQDQKILATFSHIEEYNGVKLYFFDPVDNMVPRISRFAEEIPDFKDIKNLLW